MRSGSGLATADLDRNGFLDKRAVPLNCGAIFRGHPGGVHPAVVSEGVENAQIVTTLAATDVDRDGHIDIVALGCCRSEGGGSPFDRYGMTVHYGNGAGGVGRKLFYPMEQNFGGNLKAIDMNRDGVPDLVKAWGGAQTGGVDIMLHNRMDGFQAPIRLTATSPTGMSGAYAIGDFDHDGLRDVVVSRNGNAPQASYVQFRQAPVGVFAQVRDWRTYDIPNELLAADMNGDARDDLLTVHSSWSSIGYQPQADTGLDTEVKSYTVQSGNPMPPALAAGDLDGDGCKDAAMADYNYGLIVLHGANCVVLRDGAQPRLPRKPATTSGPTRQASTTLGAGSAAATSQEMNWPPSMPAYDRIVRSVAAVWQRPFTRGERFSISIVLFGLLSGAWWLLRIRS
ncbi:MAG: VCBS repeat-containing protein [Lysobacteraceae bacterium]|nr:MAG: VCBS repeat-containing protein [Xanthomonadaceae bacterium]